MDNNVIALQQFEVSAEDDATCVLCLSFISSDNGIEDGTGSV